MLAPDIMPVEVLNAWWRKVHRREMSAADLDEAIVNLLALGVEWVPTAPILVRAVQLATRIEHPVYDCVYLALAASRSALLATVDARLAGATGRLEVPLWAPLKR